MRKIVVSMALSCVLVAGGVASAGHYEGWTDDERVEHDERAVEPCLRCPAPRADVRVERLVTREAFVSRGADAYDDSQSHPLRILAYLIQPVGYSLEWLITRPFHEFVAQPDLEPVFGHEPHAYYGEASFGPAGTGIRRTYLAQ